MLGRIAVLAASIALASCAGLEPAGRNSGRDPTPPPAPVATRQAPPAPVATRPTPPPQQPAVAPTPTPAPALTVPPQAAPRAAAPAPTPMYTTPAPQPAPSVAAPAVSAPPPTPQRTTSTDADDDIVVPGQREQQVRPPAGDPRSNAQRMEDVRAWDQCVTRVQSAFESDPMRPQMTTPEEYCGQSLGMTGRLAVPESRRQRQR